ncbi:hypothetical protein DVJ78_15070 [Humibacter sp. BT305]|uniref:hypothetical protein n=1 Tax=Cnuibacter physcomitrellae TaxID=1619308 RepID=UPI000E106646|nr:hypothetical protein [Cnuibacter physcomitrellae]AXH36558.1 hypothetical protein DVJ78_15070 [Humibacter sp. BT305]MCS5499401.1 hypothetical protein [Cnuibacter physcomitrellae]
MSDDLRIVEHEQDGALTFYVVTDLNPDDFPDAPNLGPFDTRAEAEAAAAEWDREIDENVASDGTVEG